MNKPIEHFHAWIVRDVRDRCLQIVAKQMEMPTGVLSTRKLAAKEAVANEDAIARMAMHITDLVIERFLFEVDQLVASGQIHVELRSPNSTPLPILIDNSVLLYHLYHEWIQKYSAVKGPSELRSLVHHKA